MEAVSNSHNQSEFVSPQNGEGVFAYLAEILPVGIFHADPLGNCLYVNDRWCQISGLKVAEASGLGWLNGIYPSDRELVEAEWNESVRDKRHFSLEYRFLNKDGKITWVYGQSVAQQNKSGETIGYVGTITDISDRKLAEETLKKSEERLRMALKAANQGLYDLNIQTGESFVTPEYAIMLGYDPAEFQETNAKWIERLHPDDKQIVADVYHAYIAGDIPEYKVEFRQQTKNGDYKWLLSLGKIVAWDEKNQPLRMMGTHTDISDRKQAEAQRLLTKQIRQELKLLENILDIILAGYWDWDLVTNQQYLSKGFKKMFGYEDHELPNLPESWQRLIFPEDLSKVLECFNRHVQSHGDVPFVNEVRYRHKDGSTIWVICSGQVIKWDLEGRPLRMIGCHIDITERKEAEQQLRKSDVHLKTAQRIGKLGSWEFELQTSKVVWSDEVFRIFGRSLELDAPSFEELQQIIHPDDRSYHQETVQAAIANAIPYEIEFRFYRSDGTLAHVEARGEPIFDQTGQLTQLVGTILDISDRRQSELKLLQTKLQLEASNQELEAFAYSVSHDLRAPLRAINGFSQALIEDYGDQFDAEGKDYFDRISKNVNRMGTLIDDLLNLSRVSRTEIQYRPVNLSDLVRQEIQELQASDPRRSVDFVVVDNAIVQADASLMGVVISNLLQNAWKFTSHHPTARIEFGMLEQDGQRIYFVCDDGAGFDMKYVSKLFGAFQRLHNTNEFSGTGIGLAIVQRTICRHGGKVWAEGAIEQGATIYFTL